MSARLAQYYDQLGAPRELRDDERAIIEKLVEDTPYEDKVIGDLARLSVQDMPDGGMGSIKFRTRRSKKAIYGQEIAEGSFQDSDGVPVSVTLSLDDGGELFELDVFKGDGSPLVRYPDTQDLKIIERNGKLGFSQS
jgi:hypothetical protein